jgi:hypothetical protein
MPAANRPTVFRLLDGGDPGGGLLAELPLRLFQAGAHRVKVICKLLQFVVRADIKGLFEVANADQPGLGGQPL